MATTTETLENIKVGLLAKIEAAMTVSTAAGYKPNVTGPDGMVDHQGYLNNLFAQLAAIDEALSRAAGATESFEEGWG